MGKLLPLKIVNKLGRTTLNWALKFCPFTRVQNLYVHAKPKGKETPITNQLLRNVQCTYCTTNCQYKISQLLNSHRQICQRITLTNKLSYTVHIICIKYTQHLSLTCHAMIAIITCQPIDKSPLLY